MKDLFFLLLLFVFTFLNSGCNDTCGDGILNGSETSIDCGGDCDSCPDSMNSLNLNFNLKYNNEPMVMFQDYTYPTGETFSLQRVSFFIANISLDNQLVKADEYIDLTSSHSTQSGAESGLSYRIENIPSGNYEKLKFSIGVTPENNSMHPSDFPENSSLSRSSEYWNNWSSYVFYKIEGIIDTNGDGTKNGTISLHIGGDEVFRTLEINEEIIITDDVISRTDINIDMANVFENSGQVYDIQNFGSIAKKDEHLSYMIELMDNTVHSITAE